MTCRNFTWVPSANTRSGTRLSVGSITRNVRISVTGPQGIWVGYGLAVPQVAAIERGFQSEQGQGARNLVTPGLQPDEELQTVGRGLARDDVRARSDRGVNIDLFRVACGVPLEHIDTVATEPEGS